MKQRPKIITRSKFQSTLIELTCQLIVALLYVIFGYITNYYLINHGIVSAIWLGSGVALTALLIGGWRYLWGAFFGMLALNTIVQHSLIGIVGVTVANVLEAMLGFWLLSKKGVVSQNWRSNYIRLILLGGGVASIAGGAIGALTLLLMGFITAADYVNNVLTWWMGDTLGVVLIVPLALVWYKKKLTTIQGRQWFEGCVLVGTSFLAGQIIFLDAFHGIFNNMPKGYVMFFCVAIVAIRMGMRGATLVVLITAIQAISGAYLKLGFFANEIAASDLRNYWFYILILSGIGVSLATYVDKINRTMAKLRIEINERQQAESLLKHSKKNLYRAKKDLEAILSAATEISIISTDEHGLITLFNRGAELMLGYAADEMVGKQRPAIIHDLNEMAQRGQELSLEFGRPISGFNVFVEKGNKFGAETREWTYIRKDKSRLTVSLTVTTIRNDKDKITGYLGIADDITERKKMEHELHRSNADLEQFAYAVSHDMRQPLRMVTSYLGLIEMALKNQLDEDTRQFLTFAVDGAKRMDSMILSLLDYSRIGKHSEVMTVVSTRAAIDEALSFLKPALDSGGGTVEILGDWIDLVASRDELTRLFQNLIGNALKYHDENKPPCVEVLAIVTSNKFRVEVRDNGIGINPSQIDRLFKVFSRLQARSRFEGTGVGLALCRKIVEHHGGEIGVTSEGEGLGCVFWFELPLDNSELKNEIT